MKSKLAEEWKVETNVVDHLKVWLSFTSRILGYKFMKIAWLFKLSCIVNIAVPVLEPSPYRYVGL